MKDTRYKVDLSKRLDGRRKGGWLIKAKTIAGNLVIAGLVYLVIAYPWNKYKNEYLPLLTKIEKKQIENSSVSGELDQANQKLAELSKRYQTIVTVYKQRISWTNKLFKIAQLVPPKVYIAEIGLRQAKDQKRKQTVLSAPQKTAPQKLVYIRGLVPALTRGEYLAKIVSMAKKINTDPEFAKDFYPMHLNYNKLIKLRQGEKQEEMIEFELEAETKRFKE